MNTFECGHERTSANSWSYGRGHDVRCKTCQQARKNAQYIARKKTFRCGHEITHANTRMNGKYRRCVTCLTNLPGRALTPSLRFEVAPRPLPIRDNSERSYSLAPLRSLAPKRGVA